MSHRTNAWRAVDAAHANIGKLAGCGDSAQSPSRRHQGSSGTEAGQFRGSDTDAGELYPWRRADARIPTSKPQSHSGAGV